MFGAPAAEPSTSPPAPGWTRIPASRREGGWRDGAYPPLLPTQEGWAAPRGGRPQVRSRPAAEGHLLRELELSFRKDPRGQPSDEPRDGLSCPHAPDRPGDASPPAPGERASGLTPRELTPSASPSSLWPHCPCSATFHGSPPGASNRLWGPPLPASPSLPLPGSGVQPHPLPPSQTFPRTAQGSPSRPPVPPQGAPRNPLSNAETGWRLGVSVPSSV